MKLQGKHEFGSVMSKRNQALNMCEDMVGQRRAILSALDLRPGERVLDVGCGSGLLAADMAVQVGSNGYIWAVDNSESMVDLAERHLEACGVLDRADARQGLAEDLPLEDDSIDAAVVVQVCLYLDSIPSLLGELHRVLRPGGRVVISETDWDSLVWHATDGARLERIVSAYCSTAFVDAHVPVTLQPRLRSAGFRVDGCRVFPVLNVGTNTNTYSHHMSQIISRKVGDSQPDVSEWISDLECLSDNYFFSLNRYIFRAST